MDGTSGKRADEGESEEKKVNKKLEKGKEMYKVGFWNVAGGGVRNKDKNFGRI